MLYEIRTVSWQIMTRIRQYCRVPGIFVLRLAIAIIYRHGLRIVIYVIRFICFSAYSKHLM